jgi:hypothetical protein
LITYFIEVKQMNSLLHLCCKALRMFPTPMQNIDMI